MEFGLFNSACVLPQFDGDEHRRIMDEVAIVQAGRPRRVQVHVGDRAPLPHGVLAPLGQRGVPRLPRGRDRTHPPRFGHLQHHAAGEPPGARRRARRAARPSQRRSLRVRHGSRFVDDRAAGLRHPRARSHPRHVRRGRRRVPPHVARRGVPRLRRLVLLDAGAQRVAEAVHEAASADVGRGREPVDVPEGGADGPRRPVLHDGRRRAAEAADRALQEGDRARRARRRLRERQHHGHDAAAVPRRRRARARARRPARRWATRTASLFRYLDTFPRPEGIPEWPDPDPGGDAGRDRRAHPRPARPRTARPTRSRARSSSYEAAGVDQVVFGLLSSTMSRELAVEIIETFGTHVLPQFDRDPVHRTTRLREAQVRD